MKVQIVSLIMLHIYVYGLYVTRVKCQQTPNKSFTVGLQDI